MPPEPRRGWLRLTIALLVGAVVAGLAVWNLKGSRASMRARATRVTIPIPDGYQLLQEQNPVIDVSPDGRTLAYASGGLLHVRSLDRFEATTLAGTEEATAVTFSPDGKWLAFTQVRLGVSKIAVEGGPVLPIAREGLFGKGIDWGANGELVLVPALGSSGLRQISADGGASRQISTVLDSEMENSHIWPQLLPDGRSVLFTVIGPSGGWEDARIVVQDIASGERRAVIEKATYGRFVQTGHIIFARAGGMILAVPFDLTRLKQTGAPFTVANGVRTAGWGGSAAFAVSKNGSTLAFVGGIENDKVLDWVDRSGKVVRQIGSPFDGGWTSVSPDGKRIALTLRLPDHNDIWLVDSAGGERERFTFETTEDESPIWSPDGKRIAYSSAWTGQARRVYVKPADGHAEPELVYTGKYHLHLTSWSPDGKWLAFYQFHPETGLDIWLVSTDGTGELVPVATTATAETDAVFSPDGRFLAYSSSETGRPEVYVVSYPELGAKRQLSKLGGSHPRWNGTGDELFYRTPNRDVMVVSTNAEASSTRTPTLLFSDPDSADPLFDVSPDGRHFVILKRNPDALAHEFNVVLNWSSELK